MILRREFLKWSCKLTGGYLALSVSQEAAPLRRINTTLFSEAHAQAVCTQDTCTQQDNCGAGDATGHTCEQKDVCDVDASGDCRNDQCGTDTSVSCDGDTALSCDGDTCVTDASGKCVSDQCDSDASGSCTTDTCVEDNSGACVNDTCGSDSSGSCQTDTCSADSSGACVTDQCTTDKSGACQTDSCAEDASGACVTDQCSADKSGECRTDTCASDNSGSCQTDRCESDSSGSCSEGDTCVVDQSGSCVNDQCYSDSSGACQNDRCNSDYSGSCTSDVCVLDISTACVGDVCREDRTPPGTNCTSDTCALDLAFDVETSRRQFAQMGINKAIKWLYKLSMILAVLVLAQGTADARTVIDSTNAVFYPTPTYLTATPMSVPDPVGAFLRDCDGDGILEADTDGDGQCAGDPEVKDYNGDGVLELPPGTVFQGSFQFTTFIVPSNVVIATTGPVDIKVAADSRVFGVMRLAAGITISARGIIDNRTSAWLAEGDGAQIIFQTALPGSVSEAMTVFPKDGPVPTIPPIVDTDNDGVPDVVEGKGDADKDGIADYQDQDTASVKPVKGKKRIIVDLSEGAAQRLDLCNVKAMRDTDPSLKKKTKPKKRTFPYGVISMDIIGLSPGKTVKVTLTFPANVPKNAEYWAYRKRGGWYMIPINSHDGDKTITLKLKDGGSGDADGKANGVISGPGGLAIPR